MNGLTGMEVLRVVGCGLGEKWSTEMKKDEGERKKEKEEEETNDHNAGQTKYKIGGSAFTIMEELRRPFWCIGYLT